MKYSSELSDVSQLIVLGRGLDGENRLSDASYERAMAAQLYCGKNPSVETVLFSGGYSSQTGIVRSENPMSEASLMADLANLPDDINVIVEEGSVNTTENLLHAVSLLDYFRVTGVLAHQAQMPRAIFVAQKVLLASTIVEMPAEMYGASPEGSQTMLIEKAQLKWVQGLMRRVEPGDLAAVRDRSELDKHLKQIAGSGLRKFCNALRFPIPPQYK